MRRSSSMRARASAELWPFTARSAASSQPVSCLARSRPIWRSCRSAVASLKGGTPACCERGLRATAGCRSPRPLRSVAWPPRIAAASGSFAARVRAAFRRRRSAGRVARAPRPRGRRPRRRPCPTWCASASRRRSPTRAARRSHPTCRPAGSAWRAPGRGCPAPAAAVPTARRRPRRRAGRRDATSPARRASAWSAASLSDLHSIVSPLAATALASRVVLGQVLTSSTSTPLRCGRAT